MQDSSKEYAFDYHSESVNLLINDSKNGSEVASGKLLTMFEPFIISIAKKYLSLGNYDDILQEGRYGLWIAILKYDASKGTKFDTFAYWEIKGKIIKYINETNSTITMSQTFRQFALKVVNIAKEIESETGCDNASSEEILKILHLDDDYSNVTIDKVDLARVSMMGSVSFDQTVNGSDDGDERTLGDMVADDSSNVYDDAENDFRNTFEHYMLNSGLDERELYITKMKEGFNEEKKKYSTKELAAQLERSESRIMQLYRRANVKIRKHMLADGYNVKIR